MEDSVYDSNAVVSLSHCNRWQEPLFVEIQL